MDMKPALIIYDFDGVMTNNKVIVDQNGIESVVCNRDDVWGVSMIRDALKIHQFILSSESNPVVLQRAKKLNLSVFIGKIDKAESLKALIEKYEVVPEEILYVGNGLNDLEIMSKVGYAVCPADAHPEVQKICCKVLKSKGGDGVVLELYELLLDWD